MTRRLGIVRAVAALAALAAAGRALLWLGADAAPLPPASPGALWTWIETTDPVVAAFSLVRALALAGVGYLLVTVVLALVARIAGSARLLATADALTLPPVRRLLQGALAVGLGAGLAAAERAPALAAVVAVTQADEPGGTATMRRLDDPPAPEASSPTPTSLWTVRPGDHLWSIAERSLAQSWGRPPTDREIVSYWSRLIEHNRARLADRDNPDLLFAGQVLELPELPRPP